MTSNLMNNIETQIRAAHVEAEYLGPFQRKQVSWKLFQKLEKKQMSYAINKTCINAKN